MLALAFPVSLLCAQVAHQDPGEFYAGTIKPQDLRVYVSMLASDAFQGRETGTHGEELAAQYIAGEFRSMGLAPTPQLRSYFQEFPIVQSGWADPVITDKKHSYVYLRDFYGFTTSNSGLNLYVDHFLFLGYGIDDSLYSDYKNVSVQDQVIMVLEGEPMRNGKSLITGTDSLSAWSSDWRKKVETATEKGAKCIMIVDKNFAQVVSDPAWKTFLSGTLVKAGNQLEAIPYCNNIFISPRMAQDLLGKYKHLLKKAPARIARSGMADDFTINRPVNLQLAKEDLVLSSENVIGFAEGSDLASEIIVLSAHYDHLGKQDGILYPGADDDASGVAAMLEIAHAVMQAKREGNGPRRSILFVAFSGEEKGLLGSSYYVDNPLFELKHTMVDLNMDMLGRIDPKHAGDSLYLYTIGSDFLSADLRQISEAVAHTYTDIDLDYTYNSTDDPNRFFYRSDQYSFARNDIPVILYFDGIYADYHQPTDVVDKIDFPLLAGRTQLIFHTLWILANQDASIHADYTH